MFTPNHDREFINLVWKSHVPITEKDIGGLLRFLLRVLRQHYRVVPNQSLRKLSYDTAKSMRRHLKAKARSYRRNPYVDAVAAVGPLLEKFTLASLLYREYRCGAIHQYRVDADEPDFFRRKAPYWSQVYGYLTESDKFLKLRFPGPFLLNLLEKCIRNYKTHLSNIKKLPGDVFFEFCNPFTDIDYLDQESIPNGKDVNITI